MADQHAVFAAVHTPMGIRRVRVSEPGNWGEVYETYHALETDPRENGQDRRYLGNGKFAPRLRRVVRPEGLEIGGYPVHFLAIRSTDDPDWPAAGPCLPIRDTLTAA